VPEVRPHFASGRRHWQGLRLRGFGLAGDYGDEASQLALAFRPRLAKDRLQLEAHRVMRGARTLGDFFGSEAGGYEHGDTNFRRGQAVEAGQGTLAGLGTHFGIGDDEKELSDASAADSAARSKKHGGETHGCVVIRNGDGRGRQVRRSTSCRGQELVQVGRRSWVSTGELSALDPESAVRAQQGRSQAIHEGNPALGVEADYGDVQSIEDSCDGSDLDRQRRSASAPSGHPFSCLLVTVRRHADLFSEIDLCP